MPRQRDDSNGLSQRAYAEHRKARGLVGANLTAVQSALRSGRISRNPKGKIDAAAADAAWEAHTAEGSGQENAEASEGTSYRKARALKEAVNYRLALIELRKREGELIPRDLVMRAYGVEVQSARDKFLAMCTRLAPKVAATKSGRKCQKLLEDAVHEILEELANAGPS